MFKANVLVENKLQVIANIVVFQAGEYMLVDFLDKGIGTQLIISIIKAAVVGDLLQGR